MTDFLLSLKDQRERVRPFIRFVGMCLNDYELLQEFDRLKGTNLYGKGTPLELLVDDATGRTDADATELLAFIIDAWERRPHDAEEK